MDPNGKKIHFMGVGGIGMSALALLARSAGAQVSGCDREESALTKHLTSSGISFQVGHDASHADGQDILVYTSAVPTDHPELLRASGRAVRRGQVLAAFMHGRESWGISGTHGKTTTSWLIARILLQAGLDPSVFIGGVVQELPDWNVRSGAGPFVAELDESDGSFLLPRLDVAVVTNVESDHLSHYGTDKALFDAFRRYADGVSGDGLLVLGTDCPECRRLYESHEGGKTSFAIQDEAAEFQAVDIRYAAEASRFRLLRGGDDLGEFTTMLPGRYNILNCLAAAAATIHRGVPLEAVRKGLRGAAGVERRMERLGTVGGAVVYSDYAHHPTEVGEAIRAFRERHAGRTLVVFQPHLYSRTRDYAAAFGQALGLADSVLLVDIYPAREEPIPGVTSAIVREAMPDASRVYGPVPLDQVASETRRLAGGCEAVVMMGAGNIDAVAREMAGECNPPKGGDR